MMLLERSRSLGIFVVVVVSFSARPRASQMRPRSTLGL